MTPVRGPILELRAGPWSAGIGPACGGALLWLRSDDREGRPLDWLRPMTEHGRTVRDAACFAMVPFSNRIAGARFQADFGPVSLEPNWPGGMAIHGFGWNRSWRVAEHTARGVILACEIGPPDWPWQADIALCYRLREAGLTMKLAVVNRSARAMPSGLGFHPYFPRDADTRLYVECDAIVEVDTDQLPVRVNPAHPAVAALRGGRLPAGGIDNALLGWSGSAVLVWGDGRTITVTADPPSSVAVLYVPADREFLCFEPVTHIPNAHNLRDGSLGDPGLVDLAAGDSHQFTVDIALQSAVGRAA